MAAPDPGGLGDILGGIFGNRGGGRAAPRRGADVESEVTLDFDDAIDGATVALRMASEQACPTCHGTGGKGGSLPHQCPVCLGTGQTTRNQGGFAFAEPCRECRGRGMVVEDPCPDCHGSGRAMGSRTINVRIPAGVQGRASASGSRPRAPPASAVARQVTCSSSCTCGRTRCSVAPATT